MEKIDVRLPKDKFDFKSVNKIKKMDKENIVLFIPGLLEWVQDMNWPIAPEVAEILVALPREIIPHIKNVFSTSDDIWKYWCLDCIVKKLPTECKELLKDDLIRLATKPTEGEKLEEVNLKALEILKSI